MQRVRPLELPPPLTACDQSCRSACLRTIEDIGDRSERPLLRSESTTSGARRSATQAARHNSGKVNVNRSENGALPFAGARTKLRQSRPEGDIMAQIACL